MLRHKGLEQGLLGPAAASEKAMPYSQQLILVTMCLCLPACGHEEVRTTHWTLDRPETLAHRAVESADVLNTMDAIAAADEIIRMANSMPEVLSLSLRQDGRYRLYALFEGYDEMREEGHWRKCDDVLVMEPQRSEEPYIDNRFGIFLQERGFLRIWVEGRWFWLTSESGDR